MRVIAGALKGRRLVTPRGTSTRPTADQIRVALMDTLTPWLSDARVLDLFAGAGGVGLEALSRGALHATFVEREARAVAALSHPNILAIHDFGEDQGVRFAVTDHLEALRVPVELAAGREGDVAQVEGDVEGQMRRETAGALLP